MNTYQKFAARDTFSHARDGKLPATFTGTIYCKTERHPG